MSMLRDQTPGPPAGHSPGVPARIMASGALGMASKAIKLLEQIAASLDRPSEYDTTFTASGGAAAAVVAINLPRTITNAELTLSGGVPAVGDYLALFVGNVSLANAQQQLQTGQAGPSNAIAISQGGQIKVRDHLDQTGWLTIYFTAGGVANVRVRQLDKQQSFAERG